MTLVSMICLANSFLPHIYERDILLCATDVRLSKGPTLTHGMESDVIQGEI